MRAIKVFVCDAGGYGKSGIKVQEYNRAECYTDTTGSVDLTIEEGDTSIYVNGVKKYSG